MITQKEACLNDAENGLLQKTKMKTSNKAKEIGNTAINISDV
uniref:Uncharacterized protein n=1 Tax=Arundo donax TaxID=35708 RepID=A0A0A9H715_ARUDO